MRKLAITAFVLNCAISTLLSAFVYEIGIQYTDSQALKEQKRVLKAAKYLVENDLKASQPVDLKVVEMRMGQKNAAIFNTETASATLRMQEAGKLVTKRSEPETMVSSYVISQEPFYAVEVSTDLSAAYQEWMGIGLVLGVVVFLICFSLFLVNLRFSKSSNEETVPQENTEHPKTEPKLTVVPVIAMSVASHEKKKIQELALNQVVRIVNAEPFNAELFHAFSEINDLARK